MAESAASALAPSGPPACAISGRPPPPLPPSTCEATRARSTALKREVRSLVTPTTTPALPSPVTPTIATTPEPSCFLPSSARLLRSFISIPSTARAISLTLPTSRPPAAPAADPLDAAAPPPIARSCAILLAEQRTGAVLARVIPSHHPRGDVVVFQHYPVGDVFDAAQFLRHNRLLMHEVEAQAIRRHQRTALRDVVAEHLPQRL